MNYMYIVFLIIGISVVASVLLTVLIMCLRQSSIQAVAKEKEEKELQLEEFSSIDEY